jgi:hypothetical protein
MLASIEPLYQDVVDVRRKSISFAKSFLELIKSVACGTERTEQNNSLCESIGSDYKFSLTVLTIMSVYNLEYLSPLNKAITSSMRRLPTGRIEIRKQPGTLIQFISLCSILLASSSNDLFISRLCLVTLQCMACSPTTCLLFYTTPANDCCPRNPAQNVLIDRIFKILSSALPETLSNLQNVAVSNITTIIDIAFRLVAFQIQVSWVSLLC